MSRTFIFICVILGLAEVHCLECYECISDPSGECGVSQLSNKSIKTCGDGLKFCATTFAVKSKGIDITRQCYAAGETGTCQNGTSYAICTCNTNHCNNIDLELAPVQPVSQKPGDGGGAASALHSVGTFLYVIEALLFISYFGI